MGQCRICHLWIRTFRMETLFEDEYLLVINKSAGFITEGPEKNGRPSLSDQLREQSAKPLHPCHRLDKDTSGVLVFAKSKAMLARVSEQFAKRKIRKTYLVRVDGIWNSSWNRVESHIQRNPEGKLLNGDVGKKAITTFRRLAQWQKYSLLESLPKTGRTHQIRLHCLFHKCPISGDGLYGSKTEEQPPMALHAWQLRFQHPMTSESQIIKAPLPDYWRTFWLKHCPIDICRPKRSEQ